MAQAVGAKHAFFTTCGSSLSVKSAMLAVAGRHRSLLLGRDAHKSAIAGLVLGGIEPRWLPPRWDVEQHLAHPPAPQAVAEGLARHPDVGGVMINSPSPYGTCADLSSIAEICHRHDKPLLVDEAWGAHLPFHESLPTWAMDAGADLCIVSILKMGAGLDLGSVFHLQGDLIDPGHLAACADMLATTSPNVLIHAAMDGWRRQMVQHGRGLLGTALDLAHQTRTAISELKGFRILDDELLGKEASHDLDRLHVLVDVEDLGISGYQAADWLRTQRRVNVHLSDARRIEIQLTHADDHTTLGRLLSALQDLGAAAGQLPAPPRVALPDPGDLELDLAMPPRDAFFAATEDVSAEEAVGRVAAEQVTPYPPGIPVLLPGERIGDAALQYLRTGVRAGMVLPDANDPTLSTVRVVA